MKKNFFLLLLLAAFTVVSCSDDNTTPAPPPAPAGSVNMTEMCHKDGSLYGFLSVFDENWNTTITHTCYNTATGAVQSPWITDGSSVPSPYKLFAAGDYICFTSSDYVNDGEVYLYTPDGKLLTNFTTGIGPRRGVVAGDNLYVLCEGLWGYNNAVLTKYNLADNSVVRDCFMAVNNLGLGDTANDICVCGDKMYISIVTDNVVWVTDLNARVIEKIDIEGQPRYFAVAGDKVYVTLFNGTVACINSATNEVEATVAVGRNPEQICVSGNKLFVANSGGADYPNYDKTVSVIDIPSFSEVRRIDVATNPANILTADNGYLYLVSLGNYGDIPNTLQCINPDTYEVTLLSE